MRNLGRIVLGAFAAALRDPPKALKTSFAMAMKSVHSFIEFHLMVQYTMHIIQTLNYMDSYWKDFHNHRDIFLEFRAYKRTKLAVKERQKALQESLFPTLATSAGTGKCKQNSMSHGKCFNELQELQESSHFNFVKMHLLTHFQQHLERFCNILMFSTEVSELVHEDQIKDNYRASNKVDAVLQILDIYVRHQACEIWLLNLKAIYRSVTSYTKGSQSLDPSAKDLQLLFEITKARALEVQVITAGNLPRCKLLHRDSPSFSLLHVAESLNMNRLSLVYSVTQYAGHRDGSESW